MILGMTDLEFLLSMTFLIVSPFIAWGIYAMCALVGTVMRVRTGNVKVWKVLPNDQVIKFWAKPEGGKIKLKTKNPNGILNESIIEVNLGKGWIWREGGVPFIKLDKDNNQVSWKINELSTSVPKEIIDEIADTAWASGTMVGFSNLKNIKQIMTFVILNIAITAIIGFVIIYFVNSIHITTQVVNVISTTTTTIPVV